MKRLASNIVLGLFVLVLVTLYGISKQPSVYSFLPLINDEQTTTQKDAVTNSSTDVTQMFDREVALPNGDTINVAVADNPVERIQGLSGLTGLEEDEGMLFIFDETGKHGIWMKNMNFAIDILWLDETGRVVHVVNQAPVSQDDLDLLVYQNDEPAKYVLEVPAGVAEAKDLEVGAQVQVL
ncbi:MAG: DUF192 domain-containing protein [Patescibacteria group bacterium]|nr:DUF192 domain-containing protein [Patescibacteria group bacterium]